MRPAPRAYGTVRSLFSHNISHLGPQVLTYTAPVLLAPQLNNRSGVGHRKLFTDL